MIRKIANLKYLIATFLFVTLFFIQSLTLVWTPGYAFQALILNIAIMLGVYAFRGFDNLTTYSLNSCIVSYISGTVLGVLFALIPIVFFTPRLPRLTFFVTAAVSALVFPFASCMLMRYTIRHLPPKRYLVIGREEELGPILEEVKKASIGKIEIYSYMNPSAATLTEAISFEDVKPFDAILIGDPKLANTLDDILEDARTNGVGVEYLPSIVEKTLFRIPLSVLDVFKEYYEVMFSESRYSRRVRVIDLILSCALFILALPFSVFSILLILFMDGRPIIYKQRRIAMGGKRFNAYKFRTMEEHVEQNGALVTAHITKSGRILRKTRLNEIPQLLNVIKGDISLVGPRPDLPVFYDQWSKEIRFYRSRFLVPSGVTGHAQVLYKYADTKEEYEKRLEYDLYYVKNMDFRLYLATMLRTAEVMLFRRGAK
ncbi:sugar transferase [Mesotoga sp. BH458_6_3_2_1]|uniref:sugar transferase n=1 Tax=Mesotoga sp. BH458_6_3_2_1 TaxID=1437446 RepID=UPI000EF27C60|nr:sugar transferase [Mesotoga sp. BH458_6_3_2_1]RLL85936.1 exopolysaccharide biosynthesis polyprenyl glycosylphosphotransferase [Mesotoga sp. BH458_6_3_2_1]